MLDTDTIIITVMGVRASATIFKLSWPASSDSLKKDQCFLTLTQSTFLHLSFPGGISGISRQTPEVNCALQVPSRCTLHQELYRHLTKSIPCSSLTSNTGIRWQRRREEYNITQEHSTTGKAWERHTERSQKHTNCRSTISTTITLLEHLFCPCLIVQDKRYSAASFKCFHHQNLSCPQ